MDRDLSRRGLSRIIAVGLGAEIGRNVAKVLPDSNSYACVPKEAPFLPEAVSATPFPVLFAGAYGAGESLTVFRRYLHETYGDDVYVPSSIFVPDFDIDKVGIHPREDVKSHNRRVGQEIGAKAASRPITIIAHSAATIDSIDIANELLDCGPWTGKEITINFLSPVGFTKSGPRDLVDQIKGFIKHEETHHYFEQHMAYPLPEIYYATQKQPLPEGLTVAYKDTPQDRTTRREKFVQWTEAIHPDPQQREAVLSRIAAIDQHIVQAIQSGQPIEDLLQERGHALGETIQGIFTGKNIPREVHEYYKEKYRERPENLADRNWQNIILAIYLVHFADGLIKGPEALLRETMEKARQKGVTLSWNLVFQERDTIIPLSEAPVIAKAVRAEDIAATLHGVHVLKEYSHAGFSFRPEVLSTLFARE